MDMENQELAGNNKSFLLSIDLLCECIFHEGKRLFSKRFYPRKA